MRRQLVCCWLVALLLLLFGVGGLVGLAAAVYSASMAKPRLSIMDMVPLLVPHLLLLPSLVAGLALCKKCLCVQRGDLST